MVVKRKPAGKPTGKGTKKKQKAGKELFRQLQMQLNSHCVAGNKEAVKLRTECQALQTTEEKIHLLRDKMCSREVEEGRMNFDPSKANQARGIERSTLRSEVIEKRFLTSSPACRRTLCIYDFIREQSIETELPLPRLVKVTRKGLETTLAFEFMGLDAAKFCPVSNAEWSRLKQKALKDLRDAGLVIQDDPHRKNWCLIKAGLG